jgi:signal transduction histidine kinase
MIDSPYDLSVQCTENQVIEISRRIIQIRWAAPALILLATLTAYLAGVQVVVAPVLIAAYILVYNAVFHWQTLLQQGPGRESSYRLVGWQVALDGSACLLLICFTGGLLSPLIVLIGLPVLMASALLPPRAAYALSAGILAGLALVVLAVNVGWPWPQSRHLLQDSVPAAINLFPSLLAFTAAGLTMFAIVFFATSTCESQRRRIVDLEKTCNSATLVNRKLQTLFSIIETIGSTQRLEHVLEVASSELAAVMQVKGISVKLLSEDGKTLRYAAAFGLPEKVVKEKVVEVDRSPLNRRVIEGEPFVTGHVTRNELFQFGEILSDAQIKSVLFLPLHMEGRVIGILGAYCVYPNRFSPQDVDFFRQAAALVAIALENARAYEEVKKLVQERSWYLMRVTHNLRAPLAAMLSILEVVRAGYLGTLNDEQQEYLRRLDRRSRTMLSMINELMTLARSREQRLVAADATTDPQVLARRIRRTFQDTAAQKNVSFRVSVPEDIPHFRGQLEMIEQILENLASNAIKYTPAEGSVEVKFSRADGTVRVEVSDTGIGIPHTDKSKLFTEFFRAENAKALEETGTGLGLAIVKELVDKLGGRILVESEEGAGTIFVVHLPIADSNGTSPHPANAG